MFKQLLIFLFFLILASSSVMAMYEVKDENDVFVPEHVVIDDTNSKVVLPPGLEHSIVVNRGEESLPDNMKDLIVEEPVSASSSGEELPPDMADLMGGGGEDVNNINYGTDNMSGNNIAGMEDNNNVSGAIDYGSPEETKNTTAITFLWFVLGILIFILVIAVLYVMTTRKKSPALEEMAG